MTNVGKGVPREEVNSIKPAHELLSWREVVVNQLVDSVHIGCKHVVDFECPEFIVSELLPGQGRVVRLHVLIDDDLCCLQESSDYLCLKVLEIG
jgi:hypothetical protein